MKKKKKRLNKKALLVIVLILYLFVMSFYYCFNLPVKQIEIKGNSNLNDQSIINTSDLLNHKLFSISNKKIKNNILTLDEVSKVKVKKYLTGKIVIEIEELNVLFYNKLDNVYALEDGTSSSTVTSTLGLPTLVNYTPSDIYASLIKKLSKIDMSIIKMISEIEYSPDIKNDKVIDEYRFLLRMNDGNYVYINLANFEKLNKYEEIYTTLSEKGILNLDSSSKGVIFQTFEYLNSKEVNNELSE